ncbi:MAG: type II toxin-antitoxin system PemK/MazF family toxin [Proteobacteria bacterium]|nr:type II toxin-antitoxin system PemK/MazF family toxin [Pseudomonadota bacterium]
MKGKVVLVSFPFDDLTGTTVRPAVCLTDPVGSHGHMVLAVITSQPPSQPLGSDVAFNATDPHFPQTGLRVSSTLRRHRLVTLTSSMLRRELGTIGASRQREVAEKLQRLFGSTPRVAPIRLPAEVSNSETVRCGSEEGVFDSFHR